MNYGLEDFIQEAIKLELNAAEIYAFFAATIHEDADFWAGLSWEERNHASLLKTSQNVLVPVDEFPGEILPKFIQSLIETNHLLETFRNDFAQTPPDRKKAFDIALKIENSAGEQHFQRVMESPSDSKIVQTLQELCEDDINHHARIKKYMHDVGETEHITEDKTRKLLLVIDDDSVAKLLQTILSTEGKIDVAANGKEGLQLVRENYYDLIISAVEMPLVDGLKFFTQAKVLSPELNKRFLFFTGAPTPDRLSFFRDENLRYLVKPSTINEIRDTALSMLA
jgi:CheY-like chemotaxis protein